VFHGVCVGGGEMRRALWSVRCERRLRNVHAALPVDEAELVAAELVEGHVGGAVCRPVAAAVAIRHACELIRVGVCEGECVCSGG
jgi:hypothetical protein